jgi:nucleoside-diphosphate-sugar epimerase
MSAKKVLITGVSGLIGSTVYQRLVQEPDRYDVYGFSRRRELSVRVPAGRDLEIPVEKFYQGTVQDMEAVKKAVADMNAVVHMAATWNQWDDILPHNLVGAYNLFEACKEAGVKRLIAASTIQVSEGQHQREPYRSIAAKEYDKVPADYAHVTTAEAAEPISLYSASKVWAESLAHVYAHQGALSCICIRIGWVVAEDRPPKPDAVDIWCSQRDIAQLVECCIAADENLRFGIFYGMSDNQWNWVDLEDARQTVGYVPQDRAEDFVEEGK